MDFLAGLGRELPAAPVSKRPSQRSTAAGEALLAQLWEGLGAISGVTRYGLPPGMPRTPTVSFTVAGHPSEAVARALAARGLFVSHGDFYATTVVERLGFAAEGIVRAGCACYTSEEEVSRLVEGVAELAYSAA